MRLEGCRKAYFLSAGAAFVLFFCAADASAIFKAGVDDPHAESGGWSGTANWADEETLPGLPPVTVQEKSGFSPVMSDSLIEVPAVHKQAAKSAESALAVREDTVPASSSGLTWYIWNILLPCVIVFVCWFVPVIYRRIPA